MQTGEIKLSKYNYCYGIMIKFLLTIDVICSSNGIMILPTNIKAASTSNLLYNDITRYIMTGNPHYYKGCIDSSLSFN